ncbi:MAG: diaminopimelate decarboxylase [Ruminococcaceae bacterium]|nr:diaminopimelate decarboxylase [Oscillospiraceae bacterium]
MLKHDYMKINSDGHLEIGGCDTTELAATYGTPLYVMDEARIRENMRAYKNSIDKYYSGHGRCLYASKAFSTMYMYKMAQEEGLGVDVVSGGELYTALKAGFDAKNIVFHGNNKSYDEIEMAIKSGVGRIIVDGEGEIEKIDSISKELGVVTNIMVRVKPGVDAHTHDFISTGHIDCKFGFAIENGEAMEFLRYAVGFENVKICGLHCHIGSQIFLFEPFKCTAQIMVDFYARLKDELGLLMTELNLGGGFGIKYVDGDTPVPYEGFIEAVSDIIKDNCKAYGLEVPFIYMEPGRSIVGDAGTTLYTAGTIRDIKNVRKYVSIDGGIGDNPRYILYGAEYDAILANRANDAPEEYVTICGKCCESGDTIIEKCYLPKINSGDIVAVMSTGAYNYSMASNYNRIPRPPVVMVKDGESKIIIKRETYDDIIKNDVM